MVELQVDVETRLAGTRDGTTQLQRQWTPRSAAGGGGGGDAVPRAAVLLVHGIGEHSGRYDHVGRHLAAAGYDVLGFDNRGHGQSGGRRGHVDSFSQFLDDVEDLVVERRQLGSPVVLLGHSLGGLISARYIVDDRPAPDLLVLSSPALSAEGPRWQRLAAPYVSRVAPRMFFKADIEADILSADLAFVSDYPTDPLRVGGATARLGNEIFEAMALTSASVDQITLPAYVFHGTADQLVPISASQPLAELPNVTYKAWPGLRHECLNEVEREQVLDQLTGWLDAQLAGVDGGGAASESDRSDSDRSG